MWSSHPRDLLPDALQKQKVKVKDHKMSQLNLQRAETGHSPEENEDVHGTSGHSERSKRQPEATV